MNREIKFRGKCLKTNKMVYGVPHIVTGNATLEGSIGSDDLEKRSVSLDLAWILTPRMPQDIGWDIRDSYRAVEVDLKTVGQCTGLKDKNGKEIYEGDIVVKGSGYTTGVAVWYDYAWYLAPLYEKSIEDQYAGKTPYEVFLEGGHCVEMDSIHRGLTRDEEREVIGNIYENPELLKTNA